MGQKPDTQPTPNSAPSYDITQKNDKMKRKVATAVIIMVIFVAVAIPLIALLDSAVKKQAEAPAGIPSRPSSVIWAEPDYDRKINIRTDPSYLALNRNISLKQGNRTFTIVASDLKNQTPAVGVLYNLVNTLIDGDADAYNALFSERYFEENGGDTEDPFTMQRVYDILIEEIREATTVTDGDHGTYTEYIYSLEYKINRNDGTYRVDIGHDSSRTQYFMLTDREGDVKIDRLMYMNG